MVMTHFTKLLEGAEVRTNDPVFLGAKQSIKLLTMYQAIIQTRTNVSGIFVIFLQVTTPCAQPYGTTQTDWGNTLFLCKF